MKKSKSRSSLGPSALAAPLVGLVAVAGLVAGCKGGTTVKDNPETAAKLTACTDKAAEKDKLLADYQAEIARLKMDASGGNEYVFTIEGESLVVKSKPLGGGGAPPVDDKVAAELSQKFIDAVRKSRGSIQKCYEQALKKNSSLQARTISLQVSARYGGDGTVGRASFRPDSLGSAFDSCMQGVSKTWKLPTTAAGMTFQSTVTLSPS